MWHVLYPKLPEVHAKDLAGPLQYHRPRPDPDAVADDPTGERAPIMTFDETNLALR